MKLDEQDKIWQARCKLWADKINKKKPRPFDLQAELEKDRKKIYRELLKPLYREIKKLEKMYGKKTEPYLMKIARRAVFINDKINVAIERKDPK